MQSVVFRDGLMRFRLPKTWVAEYLPDGGAQFREPLGLGVLLLNVIDFDAPDPVSVEHAVDFLANHAGHEGREVLHLVNDNVMVAYSEEGEGLLAYMWEVVHAIHPSLLRMGVFTFTVNAKTAGETQVVDIVSMLTGEIARSSFDNGSSA